MTLFLSYLINGISLGSVYAIIALGYTMVYGIAKMLNFAHGDVIMIGAYVSFCAMQYLGLPALVSVVLAMVACTALGIVIEGLAYKPLRQAPSLAVLITAIGVSYFLQNSALLIWGSAPKSYPSVITLGSINLMDGRIADNAGYQPIDVTIQEDGETAYFTSLPVKAMVQNIKDAGIPSALSYTAGSYVCNYLMYTLLYLIDRKYPNIRGGFIHVPYAMEQVVNKPLGTPSMDLHQIARGLEKAVEAVVKNDADLAVDMGTTH